MQSVELTTSLRTLLITTGGEGALSLKKGDILAAEVLRSTGGKVSLKIGAKVIEAKSEASLKAGEKVLLKVDVGAEVGGGKEIRLKILPRGGAVAATEVKAAIEKMISALKGERISSEGLTGLKTILTRIPESLLARVPEIGVLNRFIRNAGKLSGKELKELIKGSGLFLESGLKGAAATGGGRESVETLLKGDIKGAILRLLAEFKDEELIKELIKAGIKPAALEDGAEKLLRSIEYHQLQSKLNDTIDIFLTFYWKGLKEGSLIISDEKSSGNSEKCSSCTLNLHLDTLGRMSAGFLLAKESLYITFLAERAESAAMIEAASGDLLEGLSGVGLKAVSVRTRVVDAIDFTSGAQVGDVADGVDLRI